jgi:hypothetical protein
MKVGDVVTQGGSLVKLKGFSKSRKLGVAVSIREQGERVPVSWRNNLGKLVDVMWSSGKISKNFAEGALIVVSSNDLTHSEMDMLNIAVEEGTINNHSKPIDMSIAGYEWEYEEEVELYKTYGGD